MRMISSLIATLFCAGSFAAALPDEPHLYVEGTAKMQVQPDRATIRVAISEKSKQLVEAKNKVDTVVANAIKLAKRFDIKKDDIHAEQLNIHRQTRYNRNTNEEEFEGFRITRSLTLTLGKIDSYPELLQELVNAGITEFNNTEFSVSNHNELADKLKKEAIKDAKSAASELANEFDVDLDKLYSVSFAPMNVPSVPYVRQAARATLMDTESGSYKEAYNTGAITISAQVFAVYLIK
ncbi:SIMPL domain-containing protein [Pseudoalteromonas byunsanensis]|uniref:SIMPL domain-containing protein n=1 Tax=Pseudoalteromonas byunsanensis TaxID=327939 RepID=A0A1S1N5W5_9GAMM|nr:SIMPL domain-containing protein [Pseudoalteromonas byunsanensis]OHU96537.1 SIMPL domain-containing protein [Pseudoalteromonas byunsanensis]